MPKILLSVPHHKQIGKYACLPACAVMTLAHRGVQVAEADIAKKFGMTEYGTPASRLLRLSSAELAFEITSMSFDLVRGSLAAGTPVIAFVNTLFLDYWNEETSHAVVVVGCDDETVLLNDPAFDTAPQRASINGFLAAWGEFDYQCAFVTKR